MRSHGLFNAHQNRAYYFFLLVFFCFLYFQADALEHHFIVVIPSYNNISWYQKNLDMLMAQDSHYTNWHAIYIDDCSIDGTSDAVEAYVHKHNYHAKITIIRNQKRYGMLYNVYHAIHNYCDDQDIVVICDGDDWFQDAMVLAYLNGIYQDENIWLTYGSYKEYPTGNSGGSRQIPDWVIEQNAYRNVDWMSSHLRTFYAWLFKCINKEDLMYGDVFLPRTGDMAIMFPMLEMAGFHAKFIARILYNYNIENPINDFKENLDELLMLDNYLRKKKPYQVLD